VRSGRAHCNFTARRDDTLADDWDVRNGRVRCRVALLLRSSERTIFVLCCDPPSVPGQSCAGLEGGSNARQCERAGSPPCRNGHGGIRPQDTNTPTHHRGHVGVDPGQLPVTRRSTAMEGHEGRNPPRSVHSRTCDSRQQKTSPGMERLLVQPLCTAEEPGRPHAGGTWSFSAPGRSRAGSSPCFCGGGGGSDVLGSLTKARTTFLKMRRGHAQRWAAIDAPLGARSPSDG
jgi:hypothetical protein